jgi:prevent-host-death family protein
MRTIVNVHDAKTNLSKLLARVSQGEEIVIAKAGRPVAKLTPVSDKGGRRSPGSAKGKIRISDDFDAPLDEETMRSFRG